MINRNQNRAIKPSFVPKFSDPDILKNVLNSDIWKHLFLREKKAVWIFLKAIVLLKMEMFISPVRSAFRYGHGKRIMGLFILVMSALMMIAFNTHHLAGYFATFFPLAAPVVPFFMSGEQLINAAFVDIRSVNLMYFWIGYLVVSAIHLTCIYTGFGDTHKAPFKRGTSILYVLIFKHIKVSEIVVQRFIEPTIIGGLGYWLCASGVDFTFGLLLIISALCLFIQECYDAVLQFSMS